MLHYSLLQQLEHIFFSHVDVRARQRHRNNALLEFNKSEMNMMSQKRNFKCEFCELAQTTPSIYSLDLEGSTLGGGSRVRIQIGKIAPTNQITPYQLQPDDIDHCQSITTSTRLVDIDRPSPIVAPILTSPIIWCTN